MHRLFRQRAGQTEKVWSLGDGRIFQIGQYGRKQYQFTTAHNNDMEQRAQHSVVGHASNRR